MKPCQIVYWTLLHMLWSCEKHFGYYTKFCSKLRTCVGKYAKKFPNCYYAEEPNTPWDPIP